MKKLVNLRPPVAACAGLCGGIAYGAFIAYSGLDGIFSLYPPAALFALAALCAFRGRTRLSHAVFFAGVLFLFGAVYFYARFVAFCNPTVNLSSPLSVSGSVSKTGYTSSGEKYFVLDNITLNNKSVGGKMYVYFLYDIDTEYGVGYDVAFYGSVNRESFFSGGTVAYRACEDVRYYGYVLGSFTAKYRFSFFASVNRAISSALYSCLDRETASVCQAMLTGATDEISSGTLSAFRNAGVAHIFAVSGLHIGVIYGCLTFVFKRLRVPSVASAAVRIAAVLTYCGVCGFSASSVRAVVMCSVAAVAGCLNRKYDPLNGLAVAAMLIAALDPFQIFRAGFILSFSAVVGIILLSRSFKRVISFLPKKLADAISVTFSAQFGTLPAQIGIFGGVSFAGLLLNLVFIPLFSAVYVVIFVGAMLCAAFPALSATVLPAATAPVQLIINAVVYFGFDNAVISAEADISLYVVAALFVAVCTDKLNLGLRFRALALSGMFAAALIFLTSADAGGAVGSEVRFSASYSGGYCLISNARGSVLVVTETADYIDDFALISADTLIIVGGDFSTTCIYSLGGNFSTVYVCADCAQYPPTGAYKLVQSNDFCCYGISFTFTKNSLVADIEGVCIGVAYDEEGETYLSSLPAGCEYCLYSFGEKSATLICCEGNFDLTASSASYMLRCSEIKSLRLPRTA